MNTVYMFAVGIATFALSVISPMRVFGSIALISLLILAATRFLITQLYDGPLEELGNKPLDIISYVYTGPKREIAMLLILLKISTATLYGAVLAAFYFKTR